MSEEELVWSAGTIPVLVALYRPTDKILARLAKLSGSIDLYVFDNSMESHREKLPLVTYQHCSANAGIVGAFDWMLFQSRGKKIPSFVFFDQDTIFDDETIRYISKDFLASGSIAALVHYSGRPQARQYIRFVINSGSVFRVEGLSSVWGDVRSYFVDAVDLAVCASMRCKGGSILSRWAPGIDHYSEQGFRRVRVFGGVWLVKVYPKVRRAEFYRGHSRLLGSLVLKRRVVDSLLVAKFIAAFGVTQAWSDLLTMVGGEGA
jgi:hypothetical protein